MTTPTPPTSTTAPARPVAGPLEITALITAFVVAPIGLALGLVSLIRARANGFQASVLAIVAIILGAVLTILAVVGIVAAVLVAGSINTAADTKAFCARYSADASVLDDVDALRPEIQKVTADHLPNQGPTEAERTDVASRAEKLSSRLDVIALSDGHSYPPQWNDMTNVSEELRQLAKDLRNNGTYSGEGGKPSTDETTGVRNDMTALCR